MGVQMTFALSANSVLPGSIHVRRRLRQTVETVRCGAR